jgi:stress response protein SCP2
MTRMSVGDTVGVTAALVRASLFWSVGDDVADLDASALLLQGDGRVSSDADLVFYNQPDHVSGTVKHAGKFVGEQCYDVIDINLAGLPATIARIVLAGWTTGGSFAQVRGLRLAVSDLGSAAAIAEFPIAPVNETAFVTGELYRRDGGWTLRSVGRGFGTGFAGLAAEFGVDLGGEATLLDRGTTARTRARTGSQLPAPSFAPGELAVPPAPRPEPPGLTRP